MPAIPALGKSYTRFHVAQIGAPVGKCHDRANVGGMETIHIRIAVHTSDGCLEQFLKKLMYDMLLVNTYGRSVLVGIPRSHFSSQASTNVGGKL